MVLSMAQQLISSEMLVYLT